MKSSILKFMVAAIFSFLFTSANGQSSIDYNTFFKEYAQKRSEKHGINTPKGEFYCRQPMPVEPYIIVDVTTMSKKEGVRL